MWPGTHAGPSNMWPGTHAGPCNMWPGTRAGPSNMWSGTHARPCNMWLCTLAGPCNMLLCTLVGPCNMWPDTLMQGPGICDLVHSCTAITCDLPNLVNSDIWTVPYNICNLTGWGGLSAVCGRLAQGTVSSFWTVISCFRGELSCTVDSFWNWISYNWSFPALYSSWTWTYL